MKLGSKETFNAFEWCTVTTDTVVATCLSQLIVN
jgi:hypothetical protein